MSLERRPSGGGMAAQNSIPKILLLDLAFQSSPIGADVYIGPAALEEAT